MPATAVNKLIYLVDIIISGHDTILSIQRVKPVTKTQFLQTLLP
jgi:hypothetical protein